MNSTTEQTRIAFLISNRWWVRKLPRAGSYRSGIIARATKCALYEKRMSENLLATV